MKIYQIHWIWMDFNEKYWNLMNLTWFQWKVLKSNEFDMISMKSYEILWISHEFSKKSWNMLNLPWFHWKSIKSIEFDMISWQSNEFGMSSFKPYEIQWILYDFPKAVEHVDDIQGGESMCSRLFSHITTNRWNYIHTYYWTKRKHLVGLLWALGPSSGMT